MLAPDSEQWSAMVNLGSLPQSSATGGAASVLQLPQELGVVARSIPQLPSNDTGGVPNGVFVWPTAPQILMPAESVHLLAADAAVAGTPGEFLLAIWRWRGAEAHRQVCVAIGLQPPGPAIGCTALGRKGSCQPVGPQRVR